MTTAVTSSTTSSTSSTASTATSSAEAASSQFLNILLTELKNQNPIDPVSTKDFTTQLAQYSSLEQQINTNSKLDTLISSLTGSSIGNLTPTAYLGNTVDYSSNTTVVQNGAATWAYSSSNADAVQIVVTDSTGATVYSGTGDASTGTHVFSLAADSTDADGAQLTIKVTASNTNNDVITPTVVSRAVVDAVDSSSGVTMLEANGYSFKASLVTRIGTKSTSTSSTSSTAAAATAAAAAAATSTTSTSSSS